MKILYVGDLSSYARARQRFVAMQELGHLVEGISSVPIEKELAPTTNQPKLWERLRWKIGYPVDLVGLNQKLQPAITDFKPDLVWVEKANTIWPATYRKIKHQFPNLKLVYYSEDDIFLKHNRSVYLRQSFPMFDTVYTTKPRNIQELPTLGVGKVYCIFQAYDQNFHQPIMISPEEQNKWGAEVGFVGTFERERAEQMLFLAEQGIKVRVWGANWQTWKNRHPNLQVEGKAVYNKELIKVINSTKINLNFLRKTNRDLHTNRSLEIPACESFMLAERTDEHLQLFEQRKEAEFFSTPEELLDKVKFYLEREEERKYVAQLGRERCLKSGYSHHERLKAMLGSI